MPDRTTPTDRPDDFEPLTDDEEVQAALESRRTLNLPAATAVLVGIVVLAVGLAGGAGLHAAFASNDSGANQAGGPRGYGGFRGQGQVPGQGAGQGPGGAGGGQAAVGTVVSADKSQLVVKTQSGDVTVKLTGDTAIEITGKGTVSDLKSGQQVIVSGTSTDGTLTARTVRQGDLPTGGFNRRGGVTQPAR
jgi:hypothetical protein